MALQTLIKVTGSGGTRPDRRGGGLRIRHFGPDSERGVRADSRYRIHAHERAAVVFLRRGAEFALPRILRTRHKGPRPEQTGARAIILRVEHKSFLPEKLQDYVLENWLREPEILRRLREETATLPSRGYQIPPDQGQLMGVLARMVSARNCLEIGVYTGYSALAVALALPPDGRIVACDVSDEYTSVARRYWAEAGVADRIELHLRPARETLDELLANGRAESFDLAFIDADKANYPTYFERALELLRPNGVALIDNVLWHGRIIDDAEDDADTEAMRTLNRKLLTDERIDLALIPIGDGVTVARKR